MQDQNSVGNAKRTLGSIGGQYQDLHLSVLKNDVLVINYEEFSTKLLSGISKLYQNEVKKKITLLFSILGEIITVMKLHDRF